jgi:hypothetical protein
MRTHLDPLDPTPLPAVPPTAVEAAAPIQIPAEEPEPPEPMQPGELASNAEPRGPASLGEIPDFRLMGAVPEPSAATLCDDELWQRLGSIIQHVSAGEVIVEEVAWESRPASYRVGVASFISKCTQAEGSVSIRGGESGKLLAVYDSDHGYVSAR